jgi:hypothetical protein
MTAIDSTSVSLDEYWRQLVTAALLGTDRRDPPAPPLGPVAALVDDAVRPDPASRMLAAVASVAAARRAAFVPDAPADPLQQPDPDGRSWCGPDTVATWRTIVAEWPVLEDEWVLTVIELGMRLPPDALVDLLHRHRNDAVRRARVALAGGPTVHWLIDHVPELAASTGRTAAAEAVASLPELPVPSELAELLTADAHTFVLRLVPGFGEGGYAAPHKAVLVNLLARCRPAVLLDAAEALERTGVGLALALADLARLRHRMLTELGASA